MARVSTIDGKLNVAIPEMLSAFAAVPEMPVDLTSEDSPLVVDAATGSPIRRSATRIRAASS